MQSPGIPLSIKAGTRGAVAAIAVFAVGTAIGVYWQATGHAGLGPAVAGFLDSGEESTIPTWFSSTLLLTAALAAALIARTEGFKKSTGRYWCLTAVILIGLSLDEIARFHEYSIEHMRRIFEGSGLLYYAWVIPGIVLVVAFGILLLPFWWRLPPPTRAGTLVGAAMYIGGALGVEMISGLLHERNGIGIATGVASLIEEALEMLGAVYLLRVFLKHLQTRAPQFTFTIRP